MLYNDEITKETYYEPTLSTPTMEMSCFWYWIPMQGSTLLITCNIAAVAITEGRQHINLESDQKSGSKHCHCQCIFE